MHVPSYPDILFKPIWIEVVGAGVNSHAYRVEGHGFGLMLEDVCLPNSL